MDFTHYIYVGLGVAVSVLGFFLKRLKEEVDVVKARNARLEINQARNHEKIANLEKISEDRRRDIQNIFNKLDR
jgi:Tfp pilus assembly protein PilO